MSEVLDYTGIPIEPGQKVAVQPSGSSYGAFKIGTVIKIADSSWHPKVRVEYTEEKGYTEWKDPYEIAKYNKKRPETITAPQCMFEIKNSVTTIDANSLIVLHDKEIHENGKRFYISEYEARKLEQNNKKVDYGNSEKGNN